MISPVWGDETMANYFLGRTRTAAFLGFVSHVNLLNLDPLVAPLAMPMDSFLAFSVLRKAL